MNILVPIFIFKGYGVLRKQSLLKLFCDLRQGQKATSTELSSPLAEVIITTMVKFTGSPLQIIERAKIREVR